MSTERPEGPAPDEAAVSTAATPSRTPPSTDDDRVARELEEAAQQRAERAARRMRATVRDMLLSLLVVGGVVLLLVLPWDRGSGSDPVTVVDPASVVQGSRESVAWPVLAPSGLPATWRCTSARVDLAADGESIVHLGYLSPSTRYVGLEQSATKMLTFVREQTVSGEPSGSTTLGGLSWDRYESPDGKQRSLVRVADGATYVVTGQADWSEIDTFAASLTPG